MKTIERKAVRAANGSERDFEQEFLRLAGVFQPIAESVFTGEDDVEKAMLRSYEVAARQRWKFRNDGEFRRWLVRTVLNEALMTLREKDNAAASSQWIFSRTC